MVALLAGGQLVVLIAIVAVSAWGWKHIDPETRIRGRTGTSGFDYTMSKKTALLMTPLIGTFVAIATFAVADPANETMGPSLGLAVMVIFLAAHWSSVRRAAR